MRRVSSHRPARSVPKARENCGLQLATLTMTNSPPTPPAADRGCRREAQAHLDALEGFWSEWFKSEAGQFKAAFQSFASTDAFEQQLEELLRQWLQSHGLLGRRLAWPKEKGSPFRGLAPFEAEHAAVFFGPKPGDR